MSLQLNHYCTCIIEWRFLHGLVNLSRNMVNGLNRIFYILIFIYQMCYTRMMQNGIFWCKFILHWSYIKTKLNSIFFLFSERDKKLHQASFLFKTLIILSNEYCIQYSSVPISFQIINICENSSTAWIQILLRKKSN